jgi:cysteinyl-tRNA synthetase
MIKKIFYLSLTVLFFASCGINNDSYSGESDDDGKINPVFREYMRDFVEKISIYSKNKKSNFIIIPQNGNELVIQNGEENGPIDTDYVNAIDGVSREDLFYGYYYDNTPTPAVDVNYMLSFLDASKNNGLEVLVIDYCWYNSYVIDSYTRSNNKNYISFAATHRELDNIPNPAGLEAYYPYNVNTNDITNLSQAKNFLYLINPSAYATKDDFINALKNTNYDLLIIDLFFNETIQLSQSDITALKTKQNGGQRLVIAYMSIGEAEDYRYYWKAFWSPGNPPWLGHENPDWPGNYKVHYWDPDWQKIILDGDNDSYLKRIIDAGFDGVYLDLIDAFEYYE